MLNPITTIAHETAAAIIARNDRHSQQPPTPPEPAAGQIALLAIHDETGRPLAGVYVPDNLLL